MTANARIKEVQAVIEVLKTGKDAKTPEIRAFLDEYEARRVSESKAGYGFVGSPDRTAEPYSPGIAVGGVSLAILRLGDQYLADCTLYRIDGRYTQYLTLVDRAFVNRVFDASEGTYYGDSEKAFAWMPHFEQIFGLDLH